MIKVFLISAVIIFSFLGNVFALSPQEAETIYNDMGCSPIQCPEWSEQITCFKCSVMEEVSSLYVSEWNTTEPQLDLEYPITIKAIDHVLNNGWLTDQQWLYTDNAGVNLGTNISNAPLVTYDLVLVENKLLYIWILGDPPDASSDSVNYGINGSRIATITFINRTWSNYTQYTNTKALLDLVAGDYKLNIWSREDGTRISEIQITDDPNYNPAE